MNARAAPWRRLVGVAILLAALAPGAVAAVPGGRDDASITLGMALEPPNLDPTATSAEATEDVVYGNLFEGLTRIAEDGSVVPALARSWSISEDGLEYRFAIRPGVRFHDGAPLSALDVKYSLDRARAADSANPLRDLLRAVEAIEVESELSVRVELARPVAELLTYLAWGNLVIMSPASSARAPSTPIGTGPFRFAAWHKGESVVLERNDGYWGPRARLARVTFRIVPDATTSLAALRAGDIDGFANFPAPESVAALSRDRRFTVAVGTTEGETLLAINNARAPFSDIRVRRALAHAIDRAALIKGAMYGYGVPIGSHFSPHHPAYVDLTGRYRYDPAAARALLAAAGLPRGFAVTLKLPPPVYARRSGEIIAAELAAIGIRVRIENLEWAQWLEQVFKNRDFDLTIVAHTEPLDYDIYARRGYYFGYSNPAYERLLDELSRTREAGRRNALLGTVQRMLADDAVNVYLFELPKLGVWRAELRGLWREAPVQGIDVTRAWLDAPATRVAGVGGRSPAPFALAVAAGVVLALGGLALARHASARYLAGRLVGLAATVLAASVVIFLLVQVLPGDPAAYMLGLNASPAAVARLHSEYGLDAPAYRQYLDWLRGVLDGDLGQSYTYRVPVASLLGERLAVSAPLALYALLLTVALAFPLALAAAARPGSRTDRLLMALAEIGLAIPNFWLGILLILAFAVGLHWFGAGGFPGWDAGALAGLRALTLPAIALAVPQGCILARVLRAALAETLAQDYVRTARAKGLSRRQVLWRHALPNALLPALTILGLQFSFLLAGAILIETVFSLPGIGRLIFQATAQRDLIVVRSVVLLLVVSVVFVNFLVDLAHAAVDPRLRERPGT